MHPKYIYFKLTFKSIKQKIKYFGNSKDNPNVNGQHIYPKYLKSPQGQYEIIVSLISVNASVYKPTSI